jgi:hypothetical protein
LQNLIFQFLGRNGVVYALEGRFAVPFVGEEQKRSIPPDWTSQRSAKLVKDFAVFRKQRSVTSAVDLKWVSRVKDMRAVILEQTAMPVIGARLANEVDLTANHTAKLRRHDAPHELHFLDCLNAHDVDVVPVPILRHRAALRRIGVGIRSIHSDTGAAFSLAVNTDAASTHIHPRRKT